MSPIWKELLRLRWRLQKFCQFKGKKYVQYCSTYVTTAFGFFSTAYILTFRPDSSAAVSDALTKGPRPAPTTIITLKRKQNFLNFPLHLIRISLIHLITRWEQNPRLVFFLHKQQQQQEYFCHKSDFTPSRQHEKQFSTACFKRTTTVNTTAKQNRVNNTTKRWELHVFRVNPKKKRMTKLRLIKQANLVSSTQLMM